MPECFGGVDVSQTRNHSLVEQQWLDRPAPLGQQGVQRRGRERRISWLGAEAQIEDGARRMQLERTERAWIVEHHASAVVERERGARETWQWICRAVDVPVAGHAKVRLEDAAVVQVDELMLAAALDVVHASSAQRAQTAGGQASPQSWVEQVGTRDGAAGENRSQPTDCTLDLGQFGHG